MLYIWACPLCCFEHVFLIMFSGDSAPYRFPPASEVPQSAPCNMADIILHIAETYIFTPFVWPKSFPLDAPIRQFLTLYFFTNIGAVIMYFW